MNEERKLVMQSVLEGKLDSSYVTLEEVQELEQIVFELIADRKTPFQTHETMQ